MTDYSKLVEALRHTDFGDTCDYCERFGMCNDDDCIILQAADAIEELQAEVQFYDALAEEWQSAAENKERLLGLYRAEQAKRFYSATDNNGRIIQNPCDCMNIPVFSDCSESPNS